MRTVLKPNQLFHLVGNAIDIDDNHDVDINNETKLKTVCERIQLARQGALGLVKKSKTKQTQGAAKKMRLLFNKYMTLKTQTGSSDTEDSPGCNLPECSVNKPETSALCTELIDCMEELQSFCSILKKKDRLKFQACFNRTVKL